MKGCCLWRVQGGNLIHFTDVRGNQKSINASQRMLHKENDVLPEDPRNRPKTRMTARKGKRYVCNVISEFLMIKSFSALQSVVIIIIRISLVDYCTLTRAVNEMILQRIDQCNLLFPDNQVETAIGIKWRI